MSVEGPGRVLGGRYELGPTLGSGGMAVVHLAHDRVLERDVAVKILREQFAGDPAFLARFTREALHAARLSHPGLVTIFDAGVDQGTAYIVMEVVHGRTLHEVLRDEGPLAVDRAVTIAADVCEVLDVAHRAGIVHRDIKPGNILISDDGRTRVFDFGIAREDGADALTQVATVIGTAAYLSPEQAAGNPAGPQSDLYSLGCVLTEMLTGSPPFTAETPVALLYRHIHDDPGPPSAHRSDVSAALDAVVAHLLAKDPADRPADAAQARRELLAVLGPASGDTLLLPVVAPVAAAAQPRRSRARSVAIAAAILVTAVVLGLLLSRQGQGSGSPAAGSPSGSATPTASASKPPTPTPSPTPTPPLVVPIATSVPGALAALQQVIAAGVQAGSISPSAADQLGTAMDAVVSALDRAKGKSVVPRIQDLADLVTSLAADNQIAPSAVVPLQAAVSQLLALASQSG